MRGAGAAFTQRRGKGGEKVEIEKEEPLERRHAEVRESSRRKEEAGGRRMEGGRA